MQRTKTSSWVIDHPRNEASALLGIQNPGFLKKRGWEMGFWTVSDEQAVPDAFSALGLTAAGTWEVLSLDSTSGKKVTSKKCEDCETLARAGSRVYVLGSQFGTKEGPLQPKRHFVARFNEAMLDFDRAGNPKLELELVRHPFVLHRIVNDALKEAGVELFPLEKPLFDAYITAVIREARKQKKSWKPLVRGDDSPINIEGATFLEGGRLLLGLRYPVTRDGHPVIVELEGIDRLFEEDAAPPLALAVHVLEKIGDAAHPAGIRELDSRAGRVHAITGSLDDEMLGPNPRSKHARSEHWVFDYPYGGTALDPNSIRRIRQFDARARVEGIALDHDDVWYVHDDERIRIERSPLAGAE